MKGKNKSFGTKILLILVGLTLVCLSILVGVSSILSYNEGEKASKKQMEQLSETYKKDILTSITESVLISKQIAQRYQYVLEQNTNFSKEETISYLKSTLRNAEELQGTWIGLKSEKLYSRKSENDSKEIKSAYDSRGDFNPYVKRTLDGEIEVTFGAGFDMEKEWIYGPKKTKKEYIAKPYVYDNTLMVVIAYPVFNKNEYVGAVGTVLSLDSLYEAVKKLQVYKTGYAAVLNDSCDVLAHPKKSIIGKNLLKLEKIKDSEYVQKMCKNIKQGINTQDEDTSAINGEKSYFYANTFKAAETGKYWSFFVSAPIDEFMEGPTEIRNSLIIMGLITILIIILVLLYTTKILTKNLNLISSGLEDFFKFLNKQSTNTTEITIESNDEFGQMAKQINTNVQNVKANIQEENNLISDVSSVVNDINKGYFEKRINANADSEALVNLKNLMNEMLNTLEGFVGKDINKIQEVLVEYSKANFIPSLNENSGSIGKEINSLNKMITQMLQANQAGGLQLENSSKDLTNNIQVISNNATSQAASLEETAASIEEITGNIRNTNERAHEMLSISSDTKNSAIQGKDLATGTVKAMEEINNQVTSINEAITVIDQIAFQTNILSLNAAVEAATAGEAGKGFAVVAQEVRNLASRSAEAAKEIKDLVETATSKANEGKEISSSMIEGFNQLEEKINNTNMLINDVSSAAKEQSAAMGQIADAINQLDKFTQENASIADKTNTISKQTYDISSDFVKEANKSNFNGKK